MDNPNNPYSKRSPASQRASAAEVRVGDAERQDAATQLQAHFAAGRITWEELDERLGKAWAARTAGDLAVLFADLPAQQQDEPRSKPNRAVMAERRGPHFHPMFAAVFLAGVALALVTDGLILLPILMIFLLGTARARHFGSAQGPRYGHHGHYRGHHHGRPGGF